MISRVGSVVRRHASVRTMPTIRPTATPPSATATNETPASAGEKIPVLPIEVGDRLWSQGEVSRRALARRHHEPVVEEVERDLEAFLRANRHGPQSEAGE